MKKVIKFNWSKELSYNEHKIKMTEYFSPYTCSDIEKCISEENDDTILRKCNDNRDSVNNIISEINEGKEDIYSEHNWCNEEGNPTAFSLYDYLSDINAVISLSESCRDLNPEREINPDLTLLSNTEFMSRACLNRAKIDISLMINFEGEHLNKKQMPRPEDIQSYEQLDSDTKRRIRNFANSNFATYRYISNLNRRYKLLHKTGDIIRLSVNDELRLYSEKVRIIKQIIKYTTDIINTNDLQKRFNLLRAFFYNRKNVFTAKKYGLSGDECFAIMKDSDNNNNYFALSGIDDYEKHYNYKKMEDLKDEIITIKGFENYIWAGLTDDVLNFIDVSQGDFNRRDITYISPEPLSFYLKKDSNIKIWGSYFNCCERKLLSSNNAINDPIIFVRWEPCVKCLPALFCTNCGCKTVYYFSSNGSEVINRTVF